MSAHDNGGPAFPRDDWNNGYEGMHLRDWFAGQALAGWLASFPSDTAVKAEGVARFSYQIADAMLAERAKAEGQS